MSSSTTEAVTGVTESEPSIRAHYEKKGVKGYYGSEEYKNPHEARVRDVVRYTTLHWDLLDSNSKLPVLDLSAGSGEVTAALIDFPCSFQGRINAVDPYTYRTYNKRFKGVLQCENVGFEEILCGALEEKQYQLIVCSYALHLASMNQLPGVAMALSRISPKLLIITPHKRPILHLSWGWERGEKCCRDRTHAILYHSTNF